MTTNGHHDDGAKGASAYVHDSKNMRNTHVVNKSHLVYRTLLIRGGIIWSVEREILEFALQIRFVLLFDSPLTANLTANLTAEFLTPYCGVRVSHKNRKPFIINREYLQNNLRSFPLTANLTAEFLPLTAEFTPSPQRGRLVVDG